jgi:hypothetical protein
MGPEFTIPSAYGGYSVYGPVNLITAGIDEPQGDRADWITSFAEKYMLVCEKAAGMGTPLSIPCWVDNLHDPMYSSADITHASQYALSYLMRDEAEKVVAAFHALQAYNVNMPQPVTRGEYLIVLRNMLVREDGESLRVCQATPREWLESGKKIGVESIPTRFGNMSFEINSELVADRMILTLTPPSRKSPKEIIVRFRHPKGRTIRSVEIDGQSSTAFKGEEVTLSNLSKPVKVVVRY